MWRCLSAISRSHVYYTSMEQMLRNPPGNSFDLVGGHFSFSTIASILEPNDWVIGLMREPTSRLRSAFLHARRPDEDVETFTPAMRTMRERRFTEFLSTLDGKIEARVQLVMLGAPHDAPLPDDRESLEAARRVLARERTFFGPTIDPQRFLDVLTWKLGVRGHAFRHVNRTDYGAHEADIAEFAAARDEVLAENFAERALYEDMQLLFASRT